ncbi:hypothetical protein BN946_scf184667.g2 [Trametes cinnabarina]|uniref:Uncharacterized protein n=1 Tax=Pycnoporus cinnabarinus TaxID=5643 RepID=A0A060SZZ7_PYCCI|nr:hypothetical protein BN946_scf184667.g2 [Trametes cinnabarina]
MQSKTATSQNRSPALWSRGGSSSEESSPEEVGPRFSLTASHDRFAEERQRIRSIVVDFLSRSDYRAVQCPKDLAIRAKLGAEIQTWAMYVEPRMLDKMLETSCSYVETAFGHTSAEHRYYIAIYTACMLYGEDLGEHDADAVTQFGRRLVNGQRQLSPIFDRLAELLQRAHLYWSDVGADAIITGTVDALTATALEFATTGTPVAPSALRYPYYLRTRAGGGPQYTHFIFMRSWREKADSYLQILPEIEHWTLGTK